MVDTNCRLSDLQFSQIMVSLSEVELCDPLRVYQYHYALHRRRRSPISQLSNRFWHSTKLRNWTRSPQSEISLIMGTFHSRLALRNNNKKNNKQQQTQQDPVLVSMRVTDDLSTTTKISSMD